MMDGTGAEQPAVVGHASPAKLPREQDQMARLKSRLDILARSEGQAAHSRISTIAFDTDDGALAEALVPAVEEALAISARNDALPLVNALFPIVVRAIRRATFESLKQRIKALNRFFLYNFSLRGVKWRFESYMSGKPFRDVVLEHTLVCPIKQVFLIHRETGLLLQEKQSESVPPQDGDMVSGMLTAIRDFVHDSFAVNQSDHLAMIQVGNLTVWIEQGSLAVLAGIVYGDSHGDLRADFRRTLRNIHADFSEEIATFTGDTAVFAGTEPLLDTCLKTAVQNGNERISPLTWLTFILPLLLVVASSIHSTRESILWRKYVAELRTEPGIVVLEEGRRKGRFYVAGLRDPLAANPTTILSESALPLWKVTGNWEPYQALAPELTLVRARQILKAPETVTFALKNGVLRAKGTAKQQWIANAQILAGNLAGISRIDTTEVTATDTEQNRLWAEYLVQLASEPGIIVIENGKKNGRFHISGLCDPMAEDPVTLLSRIGLAPWEIDARWEPYQALNAKVALSRAQQILDPPETVSLVLENGVLRAKGTASHIWIANAMSQARGLVGVSTFQTEELVDEDLSELNAIRKEIESRVFRFLIGSPDLWPGQQQKLEELVDQISRFRKRARRAQVSFLIEIRGHASPSENAKKDEAISALIAKRFFETLQMQNLDMRMFVRRAAGATRQIVEDTPQELPHGHVVSLRVIFTDD